MAEQLNVKEKEFCKVELAAGKSGRSISRALKRSPSTILKYANRPSTLAEVNAIRQNLAAKFEQMSERLLDSVDEKTLEKMSGYQRIIGSAAAADKSNILRGLDRSEPIRPVINIIIGDPRNRGDGPTQTITAEIIQERTSTDE